jgi:hypothetical protein
MIEKCVQRWCVHSLNAKAERRKGTKRPGSSCAKIVLDFLLLPSRLFRETVILSSQTSMMFRFHVRKLI